MKSKQTGRYLRYKLAFERMDEALEEGWLLEAISLQESIISDRLISFLEMNGRAVESFQSLSKLISESRLVVTGSPDRVKDDFFDELDAWRLNRNKCIHGFCKLDAYAHDTESVQIFSNIMFDTAKRGRELADLAKEFSSLAKKKLSSTDRPQ